MPSDQKSQGPSAQLAADAANPETRIAFVAATDGLSPHSGSLFAFNTQVTFWAYGDEGRARRAFLRGADECRRFEGLFSRTLEGSDVGRLNRACGQWTPVSPDTYELLRRSLAYCERSEGTFDITMGAVTRIWDFHRGVIPEESELASALSHVNYRAIELSGPGLPPAARLADPEAAVDLGGTAKGFIADKLRELFAAEGLGHFIINLGGNVVVHGGNPDGAPFSVGIRDPRDRSRALAKIPLANGSVVTSGMSERAFHLNGRRYAHILDPKTGMPVSTDAESVSVVAPLSMDCEGFSTTLCALGIERGLEFTRRLPEVTAAVFVDGDNQLYVSQ